MAKTKRQKKANAQAMNQYDGVFALKLALYVVGGSIWAKMTINGLFIPIPIGLIAGMFATSRERLKIDRKIDYAVLLVAALIGYFAPFGLYITY